MPKFGTSSNLPFAWAKYSCGVQYADLSLWISQLEHVEDSRELKSECWSTSKEVSVDPKVQNGDGLFPPANLCTCPDTVPGSTIGSALEVCDTLQAMRQ